MSAEINIFTSDTENIELTLKVTMKLKDWSKLRKQLSTDYPSWELGVKIQRAVEHAQLNYTLEEEEKI